MLKINILNAFYKNILLLCGSYFDKVSRKISLQTVQAFEEGG
jgi:hypothetical protein